MPKFSKDELKDIQDRTEKIEEKREEKKRLREERKRKRELKKKREFREKLVGPTLLIITILLSLIIKFFSKI